MFVCCYCLQDTLRLTLKKDSAGEKEKARFGVKTEAGGDLRENWVDRARCKVDVGGWGEVCEGASEGSCRFPGEFLVCFNVNRKSQPAANLGHTIIHPAYHRLNFIVNQSASYLARWSH
jgi:hypothetical protein